VKIINKDFLVNEKIREKKVRVIGNDGHQFGIISLDEALGFAEKSELDLVLIAPDAKPPVCKIMNYGKFLYEQTKKERESRKKQKVTALKEVRLSPTIEEHDISIKSNNARKFLLSGDKVKVTIRFRGREAEYSFTGRKILNNFYSKLEDACTIEKKAKLEGRNMIMVLSPKKA
jgi:translation initiation factor IF-3